MDSYLREKRRRRIRARLKGTAERPRASVWRGTRSISVQLVDDVRGHTLLSFRTAGGGEGKLKAAGVLGEEVGKKALEAGVKEVLFDRGGYAYHGRVKAVAEGMRKAGLRL